MTYYIQYGIFQFNDLDSTFGLFSKLKGGKTQHFLKIKQIFLQNSRKTCQNSIFRKFCRDGPFFNIVNEVTIIIILI